jgi:hypothetical protein
MLDLVVWVMSLLEEMYKDGVHRLDPRENPGTSAENAT